MLDLAHYESEYPKLIFRVVFQLLLSIIGYHMINSYIFGSFVDNGASNCYFSRVIKVMCQT